ncbi:MAG: TrkA family potassium uptake protein [Acutalibacteraceae bacterium]|nr:TrkA family potassium uptake protein [Acutalibacteraceae bacterium]
MKSFLVIGLGKFGSYLSVKLASLKNEVMVVDKDEEAVKNVAAYVNNCSIVDCTNEEVLKQLGVRDFDYVFVCIGDDFKSSLEITSMAKELGAQNVISMASEDMHAKFLLKNGADKVVYPEKNLAEKLAVKYSADTAFDYIELTEEYFISEINVPDIWVDKSIKEANIRAKHSINILATKEGEKVFPMPGADYVFKGDEHLIVMGKNTDIQKFIKKYN